MTPHNLTPGCRRRANLLLSAAVFLLAGCTAIVTPYGSVYRFATDSALESAKIETPDGVKVEIGGYSSTSKIDSLIKVLEAVK